VISKNFTLPAIILSPSPDNFAANDFSKKESHRVERHQISGVDRPSFQHLTRSFPLIAPFGLPAAVIPASAHRHGFSISVFSHPLPFTLK
jgi:hypothetical protein